MVVKCAILVSLVLASAALPATASAAISCPAAPFVVESGEPLELSDFCSSPDGAVTGSNVTSPLHGTLSDLSPTSATYTSTPGYCGPDRFQVLLDDGVQGATWFVVGLDVQNGGVSCPAPPNAPPVCPEGGLQLVTEMDVPLIIDGDSCSDPNGPVTYGPLALPVHGSIVPFGADFLYTPNAGFTGRDDFTFTVTDFETTINSHAELLVTAPGGSSFTAPGEPFDVETGDMTTSITTPDGGLVGILDPDPLTEPPAPSGYELLGEQIEIVAPDATFDRRS